MTSSRQILVTGAASGIGLAIARAFMAAGAQVCGLDRASPPAELTGAEWIACDLDDGDALAAALAGLADREFAAIVSCAGIAGVGDPARVLRINFFAARRIVETLMPNLVEGGAVVLISSGAGRKWETKRGELNPVLSADDEAAALALAVALCADAAGAYVVSKELLSLYGARTCLRAATQGVRINTVSPGGVETPLIADFTRSMGTKAMNFSQSLTGGRHGRPEEIAQVVSFLVSPGASWINGAEIRVDGGLTGALASGAAVFADWD